jgi:hypothetical protein
MSSLGHLFDYAKVTTLDIRENYTTQAFAEAIRRDNRPVVLALAHAGVLGIDAASPWRVEVTTQWAFPGTVEVGAEEPDEKVSASPGPYRYIDLVLALSSEQRTCEVWIEVKVDSPINGHQLEQYRGYIDARQGERQRELVLLSPEHLNTEVPLTQIRWQDIADAIRRSGTRRDWWLDFCEYLEEIGMTEHWTLPVSAREAVALEDAYHLFRKAYTVLLEVNRQLRDAVKTTASHFPDRAPWPDDWVLRTCQKEFAEQGRVMLSMTVGRPVSVYYGYVPIDGEVAMVVWISANPKKTTDRQTVRSWAAERLPGWQRPGDGWQIVQTSTRAISDEFSSRDAAVKWFLARLVEIVDAGLYDEVYPSATQADITVGEESV